MLSCGWLVVRLIGAELFRIINRWVSEPPQAEASMQLRKNLFLGIAVYTPEIKGRIKDNCSRCTSHQSVTEDAPLLVGHFFFHSWSPWFFMQTAKKLFTLSAHTQQTKTLSPRSPFASHGYSAMNRTATSRTSPGLKVYKVDLVRARNESRRWRRTHPATFDEQRRGNCFECLSLPVALTNS
jgi:hypothetical protein